MKVVASRAPFGQPFPEVGMNDRTVFTGKSLSRIRTKARAWAKGLDLKLEIYYGDSILGNPNTLEEWSYLCE